jgi:uroporphyrinogen-III decarboxylase
MGQHQDTVKNTLDIMAAIAAISSFLQLLTPLFGLIGAIWTLMRIAEMVTGKTIADMLRRKRPEDAKQE